MNAEPKTRRKAPVPGQPKTTSYQKRDSREWVTIQVAPIVTEDVFNQARAAVERSAGLNVGKPSKLHLLRGLIRCAACGLACCITYSHGILNYRCNNLDR